MQKNAYIIFGLHSVAVSAHTLFAALSEHSSAPWFKTPARLQCKTLIDGPRLD